VFCILQEECLDALNSSRKLVSAVFRFFQCLHVANNLLKAIYRFKMVPVPVLLFLEVWAPSSGARKYYRSRVWRAHRAI